MLVVRAESIAADGAAMTLDICVVGIPARLQANATEVGHRCTLPAPCPIFPLQTHNLQASGDKITVNKAPAVRCRV